MQPDRVMANEKKANWNWAETKDRTLQDQVRAEVLTALADLDAVEKGRSKPIQNSTGAVPTEPTPLVEGNPTTNLF